MNRADQLVLIKSEREGLIKELKAIYSRTFDRLAALNLAERDIARFTQVILLSREAAIAPLEQEIEKPLITGPPE